MVDSSDFPKSMLTTPSKISMAMLDSLEASLDDTQTIPNAMNGLCILWASASGVFSSIVNMHDSEYATLYPRRALTPKQLYPHLSQYDYVHLQSEPASLTMAFGIVKSQILANAVDVDDTYAEIHIPKTSFFKIGPVQMSLYHDIIIRVNKNTESISVLYDTTEDSPFETLDSNMMDQPPTTYRQNMQDYLLFGFRCYQVVRNTYSKTVTSQEGYSWQFAYSNNYFAALVYYIAADGSRVEIQQSFDKQYYDTNVATALIDLDNVNNLVTVTIPQIYLEKNLVTSKIVVEIYSTYGAMAYNIPVADAADVKASFDSASSPYAAPLARLSEYILYPLESTLVGGSSAKSFDVMKDGVVNQTFYDRIPITPEELAAKAQASGYDLTLIEDDITNRTYFASNSLNDSDGTLLPVLAGSILLANDSLAGDPKTILTHTDGSIVILPTTIFSLGQTGSVCTPVPDTQIGYLGSLTKENLIAEMNNTTYLRQPFHISLIPDKVYPIARPYNLLAPTITALKYVKENEASDAQMTVTSANIKHLLNGTGGYTLLFAVTLTDSLKSADPSTLQLILSFTTSTGSSAFAVGTVVSQTDAGNLIFSVTLNTTYHIDTSDNITLNLTDSNGQDTAAQVNLSSTANILLMMPNTNNVADDNTILPNVPNVLRSLLCVAMQSATITLGVNMEKSIYSAVNTSWGNDVYKTYTSAVYLTATAIQYQRDANNNIVVRPVKNADGSLGLDYVPIYAVGDELKSESDITTTLSVPGVAVQNTITVKDPTGVLKGMLVTCPGIPYGITVSDIDGSVITLSSALTVAVAQGSTVIFSNKKLSISTTSDQDSTALNTLTVANTGGIYIGQNVYGFDVPVGATVASIVDQTHITMSIPATTAIKSGTLLTLLNKTAPGQILHAVGDNVLDDLGNPIIVKDRQNQYRIPAILFDGRLYESAGVSDQSITSNIPTLLNDYASGISTINFGFAEQRAVYYQPNRTIGTADFDTGNGVITNIGLEMGLIAEFYLPESIYANETVRTAIKNLTATEFSNILSNDVISVFDLAQTLKTKLGDQITGVALSGLNGEDSLRVCSLTESGCKPSVRKILYVRDDGVIDRKPDITFSFLSSSDGK